MRWTSLVKKNPWLCLAAIVSIAGCFQASTLSAQSSQEGLVEQPLPLERRAQFNYDAYILGPGDGLQIELLDLPELSGRFSIGPDGTFICLDFGPLREDSSSKNCVGSLPSSSRPTCAIRRCMRPVAYRPIRIYVGGEVKRLLPLSGNQGCRTFQLAEAQQLQLVLEQRQPVQALDR